MDSVLAEPSTIALASPDDVGTLGIFQLKRYWSRTMLARQGRPVRVGRAELRRDYLVIHASGLGLEQTAQYLGREAPTFEEFERWIAATTGGVEPARVARINAALTGTAYPEEVTRWLESIEAALKNASLPVVEKAYLRDRLGILEGRSQWVKDNVKRDWLLKRAADLWPSLKN